MLNFFISGLILISINLTVANASDYMYFAVDNFAMNRQGEENILAGEVFGRSIKLQIGTEEINLENPDGSPFSISSYVDKNRLFFKKDFFTFSTPLEEGNPLLFIQNFSFLNSEVELSSKQIYINGEELNFTLDGILFGVKNTQITCDPFGVFSTEVDKICVRKSTLHPGKLFGSGYSYVTMTHIEDPEQIDLQLKVKSIEMDRNVAKAEAQIIQGKFLSTNYTLSKVRGKCYKDPELNQLDPIKLIEGCLQESDSSIEHFGFEGQSSKGQINGSRFVIAPNSFSLKASGATMKSNNENVGMGRIEVHCFKEKIDTLQVEPHQILNGCLKNGSIKVSHIKISDKDARELILSSEKPELINDYKGLIDLDDFKKINLNIRENSFSLTSKVKIIFRIRANISGKSELNKKTGLLTLTIKKAKVGIFSAKKVALSFIKKFINSEKIKVKGDSILIQL